MSINIKPTLDTAWALAEQALGEYWRIRSLTDVKGGWEVVATDGNRLRIATGPTPLAAVRALAHLDAEDPVVAEPPPDFGSQDKRWRP